MTKDQITALANKHYTAWLAYDPLNPLGIDLRERMGLMIEEAVQEQAQQSLATHDPHFDSYQKVVLSLAMFDLAYHRLRNAATRLVLTRRKLTSDYQDAVLAAYLDELSAIAKEAPPEWPTHTEKPAPKLPCIS